MLIPLVLGGTPGTFLGARMAAWVSQSVIRRGIVIVLTLTGLKMLGVPPEWVGIIGAGLAAARTTRVGVLAADAGVCPLSTTTPPRGAFRTRPRRPRRIRKEPCELISPTVVSSIVPLVEHRLKSGDSNDDLFGAATRISAPTRGGLRYIPTVAFGTDLVLVTFSVFAAILGRASPSRSR